MRLEEITRKGDLYELDGGRGTVNEELSEGWERSHYLYSICQAIWLGVEDKMLLLKWFRKFPNVELHSFSNQNIDINNKKHLFQVEIGGERLKSSVPEFAAYEIANAVPGLLLFEHAAEQFQRRVNLSPRKVEVLLQSIRAVKTNRLYLFFADYCAHAGVKRIDKSSVDLGADKRQIVSACKLDQQY